MKTRELERIRSRFPQWSFESIQATLARFSLLITNSVDPAKRKAAYHKARLWFSTEAIGVACRKAAGPYWFGVCPDCNNLNLEAPTLTNADGVQVCSNCAAGYQECPECHGVHRKTSMMKPEGESSKVLICNPCFTKKFFVCASCHGTHRLEESEEISERGRYCRKCVQAHVRECSDCHRRLDARVASFQSVTGAGRSGPQVCSRCLSNNWHRCSGCDSGDGSTHVFHRNGEDCPNGFADSDRSVSVADREGKFRFFGYHSNPYQNNSKTYQNAPLRGQEKVTMFGLEMEVEGNFKAQAKALTAIGLDERTLYAERDSSVDVEWVAKPMTIEDLIPFLRQFSKAMRPVAKAFDARKSCGCHHNVDKHALSDEGWGNVCIAVSKYFKDLRKFSGKHRRGDYFPIDGHDGRTPAKMYDSCRGRGKSSACNFGKPRVCEFRIAGMTLNESSLVTQSKLYANLVRNAADSKFDPRADFVTVFGPCDDEMLEVLYRKEIIPPPAGVAVPEDPERPGRKIRTPAVLPEGRTMSSQHDFIVGDILEFISEDEMDDRCGRAEDLGFVSDMSLFIGKRARVESRLRGTNQPDRRKVSVAFEDSRVQSNTGRFQFTAGMFHLVEAQPPRDPSLRDPYEFRVGDVVVLDNASELTSAMQYMRGALAEVRGVDPDTVGDRGSVVKLKLLTRVKAPDGVDHLKTNWKYTAGMLRLANPSEMVEVSARASYVPPGAVDKYDFKVGDVVKFRSREDAKDDLEEAFFEIDYPCRLEFMLGCRARIISAPASLSSPLYQDARYNRVVKVEMLDKAEEYAADVAGRAKHPGEDYRFFTGMFEFFRPGSNDQPPPPSPFFFRKGDHLVFRNIAEVPTAAALDYSTHMAYLQGQECVMVSPDAVATPSTMLTIKLVDPIAQAEHESQLAGLGREGKEWQYKAGMFSKVEQSAQADDTAEAAVAVAVVESPIAVTSAAVPE